MDWWTGSDSIFKDASREYPFFELASLADGLFSEKPRDVCLMLARRNVEFIVGYLGCLRNRIVPLIIDADARVGAIQEFVDQYSPRYFFGEPESAPDGYSEQWAWKSGRLFENSRVETKEISKELALLLPTSGSTGDPKCVRVSYENLRVSVSAISSYLELDSERKMISSLPFHYTYGLSLLNLTLFSGGKMVLSEESVFLREFWRVFADFRVTDFSGVPLHFETMANKGFPEIAFSSLSVVTQAGGALAPELTSYWLDECESRSIDFFTMYGQTEASPRISYLPPAMAREKIGSVGLAIPGGTIQIDAPDAEGRGEVVFCGKNVCMGYAHGIKDLKREDEFRARLLTGDVGYLDPDGFLYLVGRLKRYIKVSGISVGLDSLEMKLRGAGYNTAVIGRENEVLVVSAGLVEHELRELAYSSVAVPRRMVRFAEIAVIPVLSSKKIDYQSLAATFFK